METAKFLLTGSPEGLSMAKRTRVTADKFDYEYDYTVKNFLEDDQFHLKEEKKKKSSFFSCCSADPSN